MYVFMYVTIYGYAMSMVSLSSISISIYLSIYLPTYLSSYIYVSMDQIPS